MDYYIVPLAICAVIIAWIICCTILVRWALNHAWNAQNERHALEDELDLTEQQLRSAKQEVRALKAQNATLQAELSDTSFNIDIDQIL